MLAQASDLAVLVQTGLMHGVPAPQGGDRDTGNNLLLRLRNPLCAHVRALMARQRAVLPYLWTCSAIKRGTGRKVCMRRGTCGACVAMGGSRPEYSNKAYWNRRCRLPVQCRGSQWARLHAGVPPKGGGRGPLAFGTITHRPTPIIHPRLLVSSFPPSSNAHPRPKSLRSVAQLRQQAPPRDALISWAGQEKHGSLPGRSDNQDGSQPCRCFDGPAMST